MAASRPTCSGKSRPIATSQPCFPHRLAADLGLAAVGYEGPGVSAAGALAGGATYMLGECQLNDLPKEERFPLMSGLVAAALPVASPSGAGLLALLTMAILTMAIRAVAILTLVISPHQHTALQTRVACSCCSCAAVRQGVVALRRLQRTRVLARRAEPEAPPSRTGLPS